MLHEIVVVVTPMIDLNAYLLVVNNNSEMVKSQSQGGYCTDDDGSIVDLVRVENRVEYLLEIRPEESERFRLGYFR